MSDNQTKQIAVVTGANKGIGLQMAKGLAKAGMTVFLGARDLGRGATAAATLRSQNLDVREIEMDVTDVRTLNAAAARIESEFSHLDVLVNNAGITNPGDGAPEKSNLDAVKAIMETNFLGVLAVTQAMLPLLKKSKSGRIVNMSSGLGSLAQNGDPNWEFYPYKLIGYNASKAAVNMLTVQLAALLKDTGILVNSADPGFTATDLNQHRGRQTVEEGATAPLRLALSIKTSGGFYDKNGPVPW